MKTISNYIGIVLALLSVAFFAGGCGDDYEYSTDYSTYNGVTLKIDLVDQNDVLNLNLINGTYVLKVNVTPEDIVIPPEGYLYTIEDETVATIKNDGTLTMLKAGETKLTVEFRGKKELSASCTVKISPILTDELKVPASIVVQEEKTLNLLPQITTVPSQASKKFTYHVADESIATVSEDGVVTGVAAGNTVITVTTTDGTDISKDVAVEVVGKIYIAEVKLPADKIDGKSFVAGQVLNIAKFTEIVPSNASEPIVKFSVKDEDESVVSVTEDGVVTCKAAGTVTILVEAQDGSGVQSEVEITVVASGWYERSLWTIDTSYKFELGGKIYNYTVDGANGPAELMLDGNEKTYFALVKPGKNYNGFENTDRTQYFIVDMGAPAEFNKLQWGHRDWKLNEDAAQIKSISLYGSNDGVNFSSIQEGITLQPSAKTQEISVPLSNFRYVRVQLLDWGRATAMNMCIAEFNVCKE